MKLLTGTEVLIADTVMIICAYSLVVARLWFRIIHQRLSLSISDICLLVACAELLAIFMILVKEHELGVMTKNYVSTSEVRKLSLAAVLLYDTCLYILKFGILAFYLKLFPVGMVRLRRCLYATMVITVLSGLIAVLMAIFWCGVNVRRQFDVNDNCSYWNVDLVMGDWIMNILSDILIFALPFPLLRQLSLNRKQIIGLFVTFGLGILIIMVSIFRFVTVRRHSFLTLYVWSIAEICTSMMVVSLPALRPLLRKGHNVFTGSRRRTDQYVLPFQEPPTSPRSPPMAQPQSMLTQSKLDSNRRRDELAEGLNYDFETRSLDGSHVELHGALSSEINHVKDGTRVQTIAVYTDAEEVIQRISEEERRKAAVEGSKVKEKDDHEQEQQKPKQ